MNEEETRTDKMHQSVTKDNTPAVHDLLRNLSALNRLNFIEESASDGFRLLIRALRPYSDLTVREFMEILSNRKMLMKHTFSISIEKVKKIELPMNLQLISHSEVKEILANDNYTKSQLVELGHIRFGISRSKLRTQNRECLTDDIRASLNNERALDVIGSAARRAGRNRTA